MADVAPGIRDDLAAAIASAEPPEEVVAEGIEPGQEIPAAEEGTEPEPASGDRKRGPDGKFLPKEADPAAVEAAPGAAEPKAAIEEQPKPDAAPKVPDITARWSEADKAMYKTLPKEAQDFVARRHRDMEADYTNKTKSFAEFRKNYEPVDQMFAPFKAKMAAQGWTAPALIKAWADVEQQMMAGKGADVIARMVRDYKIDPQLVARTLGMPVGTAPSGAGGQAPAQNGQQPSFDPQVNALLEAKFSQILTPIQQQLEALSTEATNRQRLQAYQQQEAAEQTVQNFIDAKLPSGELAHPHYAEVATLMVDLARIERSQNRAPDLNQIYERAVYATPSTREKLLAAQSAAQAKKSQDEARAKAAAARKASASVTGAPSAGQTPTAPKSGAKSLREALEEAAAEHEAA